MRFFSSRDCLAVAVVVLMSPLELRADDASHALARVSARRELAIAKTDLRHYWQVVYPRQRRLLNVQIAMTDAEVRDYQRQLRAYPYADETCRGWTLQIPICELRARLWDAELRLRDLWAERNALLHVHYDDWRFLELKVQEARLRVAELEENDDETTEGAF